MALFTHQIPTGGHFTCAMPANRVYLLAFESPSGNDLTPDFVDVFRRSLYQIQTTYPAGVVVATSSIPRMYSDGLDTQRDSSEGSSSQEAHLRPLLQELQRYVTFFKGPGELV